jgi:hypothetical protein
MKIKVKDIEIDARTLIEFRKDGKLPRLYIHEKFEKPLRWIVWTIATVSFASIFFSIDNYYIGVSIGLGLFGLSFLFDRAIVKYTTMVIQPFADFEIDYAQWINVMTHSNPNKDNVNFVGFVYKDMEYGKKFFNYIKSWNKGNSQDNEGNIILSIVEEENGSFTFYIYANPDRSNIDKILKKVAAKNFIEKTKDGKVQEGLVIQMAYWYNAKYTNDKHMRDFFNNQPPNEPLLFIPTIKNENGYPMDLDSQIILKGYKYAKRNDLHKNSIENQLSDIENKMNDY